MPSAGDDGFVLFDPADYAAAQELPSEPITPITPQKPVITPITPEFVRSAPPPEKSIEKIPTASIRVDLEKIDLLLNRVGELVITNAMLRRFAENLAAKSERSEMEERLELLERHIRDLQDAVMSVRMIPMENVYAKLPKIVRDISKKLGKQVRLIHSGDSVEIDKMMVEGLNDPLMHILRNALDHGIETAKEREEAGKDPTGLLTVSAMQENGQIIITVADDGRGIDSERVVAKAVEQRLITAEAAAKLSLDDKNAFIFSAGLSTAQSVSDISGRGVGMDVVKTNIAKLGGIVRLHSRRGAGSRFTIVLPLTLAILDGLNVRVGDQRYILPLSSVVESLQPAKTMIKSNGDGSSKILLLRDKFIPIVELYVLFDIEPKFTEISKGMLIVMRAGEERFALFVDQFGSQQQVVVKSLEKNYRRIRGIGGATVQGDGTVSLILDPLGIVEKERDMRLERETYNYDY